MKRKSSQTGAKRKTAVKRASSASKGKLLRSNIHAGYVVPGLSNTDLTVYASKGTYLRNGEQFRMSMYAYECVSRQKLQYGTWAFNCVMLRTLTREEFVDKKFPPAVNGKPWPS